MSLGETQTTMATGNLHQLQLTITGANFLPSTGAFSTSAIDVYMELIVDGKRGRKTVIMPGTFAPTWDEHFDILVKQDTVLIFQAFQHCKWRTDVLLCQSVVFLRQVLDTHNGRLDNTSVTLELFDIKKTSTKVGELFVVLSGMIVSQANLSGNDNSISVTSVASSVSQPSTLPSNQVSVLPSPQPSVARPLVPHFIPPSTAPSMHFVPVIVPHNSSSMFAPYGSLYSLPPNLLPSMTQNTNLPFAPLQHPFNLVVLPSQTMPSQTIPSVTRGVTQMHTVLGRATLISQPSISTAATPSVTSPTASAPAPSITPAAPSSVSSPLQLMSFDDAPPVSVPWSLTSQPPNPTQPLLVDLPAFSGPRVSDAEPLSTSSALLDFGFEPLASSSSGRHSEGLGDAELFEYRSQSAADCDGQSDGTESDLPRSSRDSSVSPTGEPEGDVSQAEMTASSSQDDSVLPPGWERRVDRYRRVYYVDHNTRTTTWVRPCENLINRVHTFELGRHDRDSQLADITNRFLPNPLFGDGDGGLPDGWERRLNSHGMPYYHNATTDTTLLEDPRIHSLLREDPLPDGWEMKVSDGGVIYFRNHVTKEQTYRDPRGKELKCTKGLFGVPLPHEKSFSWKLCQFRELCAASAVEGHIKILVSRENIFQDSYQQVMRIPAADLKRRMHVMFRGEQGLDYGGVAREWFLLLSLEILHPMLGLFQYVNDRNCTMQISAASYVDPHHLDYFRFIGRFIALAVFHGMFIGSTFCLPFYKKMLNKRLTLRDIESIDVEVYNSLKWIRDTNLNENKMPEMYFATDFEVLGRVEHYELKPGGTNTAVTEENKNEYIILMIDWMFSRGIEKQTQAFLDGFNDVLPLKWLQYFDEMELELMLCGMQAIDVNDWQRNTVYKHYSRMSKQVTWFWKFVQELSNEDKMRLLQFVTGTCRLPVGGFAQLMGSSGLQKFCIEKVGKEGSLPRSHTCFNRLDLPPYKSFEQLSGKLKFAIHETEGFGLE